MNLKDIKLEYNREELNRENLLKNPYEQVNKWFNEAISQGVSYPNAASLATVCVNSIPSVRTILIKDINLGGVTFFTNYNSRKARDIQTNQTVSLLLFWKELDRQIRITGKVTKTSKETSQHYFSTRSRESQVSALASNQSDVTTKEKLEDELERINKLYSENEKIPCPENWGGFNISFEEVEVWQGRPNRLHDRFKYEQENNEWLIRRLAP